MELLLRTKYTTLDAVDAPEPGSMLSPLHIASHYGYYQIMEALLDVGADPNRESELVSAMHAASSLLPRLRCWVLSSLSESSIRVRSTIMYSLSLCSELPASCIGRERMRCITQQRVAPPGLCGYFWPPGTLLAL